MEDLATEAQRHRGLMKWKADKGDERTYMIIGAAIEVHRELGPGFGEAVYQEALAVEFSLQGIPFRREVELPVSYKGRQLGAAHKADFIVMDDLILELKAVSCMLDAHIAQVIHYLKAANARTGLLVNFGKERIETRRVINDPAPRSVPL